MINAVAIGMSEIQVMIPLSTTSFIITIAICSGVTFDHFAFENNF